MVRVSAAACEADPVCLPAVEQRDTAGAQYVWTVSRPTAQMACTWFAAVPRHALDCALTTEAAGYPKLSAIQSDNEEHWFSGGLTTVAHSTEAHLISSPGGSAGWQYHQEGMTQ
jgi:hypothetical protein